MPRTLLLVAVFCSAGVLMPLAYLMLRAGSAEFSELADLLWRGENALSRNLELLKNTLLLAAGVCATVSVLAFPAAWLTGRCAFRGRRLLTVLLVMPLAVPGYLIAYSLRSVGGSYGSAFRLTGIEVPIITGFWGALLSLSAYLFPYMYLNVRASVLRVDPGLEEAACSLGAGRLRVFFRVVLPQLLPGYLAGALLVVLHVIGDLGVVYFMTYETFSYRLFQQYSSFDLTYAACIALMLMAIAGFAILGERWLVHRFAPGQVEAVTVRKPNRRGVGWWGIPTGIVLFCLLLVGLVIPLSTIGYWMTQPPLSGLTVDVTPALWGSFRVSLPAAVLATLLAVPIGFLAVRYRSRLTWLFERSVYVGYATPPLAFALGLIFFSLRLKEWTNLPSIYPTAGLLVYAYGLHFLAESLGPVRGAILSARVRLEEASHSLGHGSVSTFCHITVPMIRTGVVVGMVFVFLSAMKELPMTALLQPFEFSTLAYNVWDATNESDFAAAAPYALTIVLFSSIFVGLLLYQRSDV